MRPTKPSSSPFAAAGDDRATSTGAKDLQETITAIKDRGLTTLNYLRDKTVAAGEGLKQRDWSHDHEHVLANLKLWGTGAAERVQKLATSGWASASTGLQKRLAGGALTSVCRGEAAARPCPRAVLVLCTALVAGDLKGEGLFLHDAPASLTAFLLGALEEGAGAVLPPPGTSPLVLASTLKAFFLRLPEPLLTHKLVPQLVASGMETDYPFPGRALPLLGELPGPNLAAFQLLLETLHRVVGNSPVNGASPAALAAALTPVLAWKQAPAAQQQPQSSSQPQGYSPLGQGSAAEPRLDHVAGSSGEAPESPSSPPGGVRVELDRSEATAIARVLEYAITSFKDMQAHGPYQTP